MGASGTDRLGAGRVLRRVESAGHRRGHPYGAEGGTIIGAIENTGTELQPAIDNLGKWCDFTQSLNSPIWQAVLSGLGFAVDQMGAAWVKQQILGD